MRQLYDAAFVSGTCCLHGCHWTWLSCLDNLILATIDAQKHTELNV